MTTLCQSGVWSYSGNFTVIDSLYCSIPVPPQVTFRTKRIGQSQGKETVLECLVAANPQSVTVWKKNGDPVSGQSPSTIQKYRTNVYTEDTYTLALNLAIINLNWEAFGNYTCEAQNMLGVDRETMTLYGR